MAIVCLVYLDANAPAHMRYAVRRLRRKVPKATVILGCLMHVQEPAVLEQICEMAAKADLIASSIGEALKLFIYVLLFYIYFYIIFNYYEVSCKVCRVIG